ncbi:MAG: YraN family protein [Bacteroidales bacterium]|nr:YraN family protein [Bacteroidales bacterium]
MALHNQLGKKGEEVAKNYLIRKGYHILDSNWRCGKLELDIIADTPDNLVVVEVKTRRNSIFGNPVEAITKNKIRRIVTATHAYIKKYNIELPVRFDIITILGTHDPYQVKHYPNAFYPPIN